MTATIAGLLTAPALAAAEETVLCKEDPAESLCPKGQVATHVHFASITKGKFLAETFIIECDVLFLGEALSESGKPLVIHGNFTYSNCKNKNNPFKPNCLVGEENGPAEIEVLREGHETAKVIGEWLVHVGCSEIDCIFNGLGLITTAKGPLLSAQTPDNGEVSTQEQVLTREASSLLCPKLNKLDLTLGPSEALYLTEG